MPKLITSISFGICLNLVKMLCIYLVLVLFFHRPDFFIHLHGDTMSYFDPILHLINQGSYSPDYRMPGYGFLFYGFFLLSHSQEVSFFLIILLQFILTGMAYGLIAQMVFELTGSRKFYALSFLLMAVNYYLLFDSYLSTESIATSLLILISYLCFRPGRFPLIMGLAVCWLIFLKSIFCLLIIPLGIYLSQKNLSKRFFLLLLLPIILIEGSWVLRNAIKFQAFVPLTYQTFYPEGLYGGIYGFQSVQEIIRAYGGSHQFWRMDSEAAWYFSGGFAEPVFIQGLPYPNFREDQLVKPNPRFMTSQMNLDSLLKLRRAMTSVYLTTITNGDPQKISNECKDELAYVRIRSPQYVASIRQEKPFLFYVEANLNRIKNTFFTTYFFDNVLKNPAIYVRLNPFLNTSLQAVIHLINGMLWFFSSFALLLTIYFGLRWRDPELLTWLAWLNGYTLFLYLFIFKQAEERYFCVLYPIWILMSLTVLHRLFIYLKRKWN